MNDAATKTYRDKHGRLAQLIARGEGSLELGCGPYRLHPGAVGVDALDYDGVDVVGDVMEVLGAVPDGCIEAVYSSHFLEHVPDLAALIREVSRVLRPGGRMVSVVPHFSNPYFYSDPTHNRFFGLYTMSYFAEGRLLRRKVPRYGQDFAFELTDVRLGFRSPFRVRYAMRLPFQWLINSSRWMQEFYEEFLTPFLYCYEVTFVLTRRKRAGE